MDTKRIKVSDLRPGDLISVVEWVIYGNGYIDADYEGVVIPWNGLENGRPNQKARFNGKTFDFGPITPHFGSARFAVTREGGRLHAYPLESNLRNIRFSDSDNRRKLPLVIHREKSPDMKNWTTH